MKKLMLIVGIVALLIGSIAMVSFAADNGATPPPAKGAALKLTADQQQKLLEIRQAFQRDTLPIRQDMEKKNIELKKLWKAPTLDQTAIDAKTKEITALKIQMVTKMRDMLTKVKAILTPEQLKEAQKMMHNHKRGFDGKGKGRGQGQGQGCRGGFEGGMF